MASSDLDAFHEASRGLPFREPARALLEEFRQGRIADRDRKHEDQVILSVFAEHNAAWDLVFPPFPRLPAKRRTMMWEHYRGRRDAYLRELIVRALRADDSRRRLVVNPVTVAGRHARMLARKLPDHEVIGTDVDPRWGRNYGWVLPWSLRGIPNYTFVKESIYEPDLDREPAAVVFFGACGALTDASMDYAVAVEAPYLICRSCCHENVGGNTEVVKRPTLVNRFFRWKNRELERHRRKKKWPYQNYFSERYPRSRYPRSRVVREMIDSDTLIDVARNTPDSDICRSLIDLDRCEFLRENDYDVIYREELFFARRREASESAGDRTRR